MRESPCRSCAQDEECGLMCAGWKAWFKENWKQVQIAMGVSPPKEKQRGRPAYIYEVRRVRTGEVLMRGLATEVAQMLGWTEKTVRVAAAGHPKGGYRITKLETGAEESCEENDTCGADDAGRNL